MDRGEYVVGTFLDISNVFDNTGYGIVLKQLILKVSHDTVLTWLEDYLTQRTQYVTFN